MKINKAYLLLALIIVTGAILRLWGLDFGLPYQFHQDEPMAINHAISYGSGDFNPHFFQLPPLIGYLLFISYGLFYVIGLCTHFFTGTDSFLKLFIQDPTSFYIIARLLLGFLPGVLSIICVYKLAYIITNKRTAYLSAFFLSVVFIHVRNSHYAYHDISLTLCIMLVLVYSFHYLEDKKIKNLFIAGAIAGIAAGFKYNGALIIIPVLVLPWLNKDDINKVSIIKYSFYFLCTFFIFCFLTNPYAVLDYKSFIQSLLHERQAHGFVGWFHHIGYSCFEGMGTLLTVLSAFGALLFLFSGDRRKQVVAFFIFLTYLSIVYFGQHHERYILPMVPFLIIMACFCIDKLLARIADKKQRIFATIFVIIVCSGTTMTKSVYSDILFARVDTRSQAVEWILKNLPEGERIAVDHSFFSPRLTQSMQQIDDKTSQLKKTDTNGPRLKKAEILKRLAKEAKTYNVFFLDDNKDKKFVFSNQPYLSFDIGEILKNNIDYVVLHTDYPMQRYSHEDFKESLLTISKLVKGFNPYKTEQFDLENGISVTSGPFRTKNIFARRYNGPVLFIYKIDKNKIR